MDGFQLCAPIKTGPHSSRIPVIFYTGSYNEPADREFGLSLGAAAYLVKPLEPREFIAEVTRAIGRPTPISRRAPSPAKDWAKTHADRLAAKLQEKVHELNRALETMEETLHRHRCGLRPGARRARGRGSDRSRAAGPPRPALLRALRPGAGGRPQRLPRLPAARHRQADAARRAPQEETPLSSEEWEIFKRQPGRAADILRNVPGLHSALDIVQHTRERWDGSGYPDGPGRREDPARVPHLCHVRLVRRHHHRPALPPEAAGPLGAGRNPQARPAASSIRDWSSRLSSS